MLDVLLPDAAVGWVAVVCVLVGAKMIELGMDIVVAESVPVGTSDSGASEDVDVVEGADVVVLGSTVVDDCVEMDSEDSLLAVEVVGATDVVVGASEEAGSVDDVIMGTTLVPVAVDELLPGAEVMGVS